MLCVAKIKYLELVNVFYLFTLFIVLIKLYYFEKFVSLFENFVMLSPQMYFSSFRFTHIFLYKLESRKAQSNDFYNKYST